MGERRGHPVAGWVIGVYTAVSVVGGGVAAAVLAPAVCSLGGDACERPAWGTAVVVVVLLLVLVGGLWYAWRVGTGGWGRLSPSTVDALTASGSCPRCGKPISREMIRCLSCGRNLWRGR